MQAPPELLSRFIEAAEPRAQRAALVELIKTKQLHRVAPEETFRLGLRKLTDSARDAASEKERLLTVSVLLRAAATAPPIRSHVESLVRETATAPFSGLHELSHVHDRLYAAKSWRVVPGAWSLDALATAAAREETGEAARKECIEGIIGLATRIEDAVRALTKALLATTFKTKKPGDSLGKRLNRVLAALAESLSKSHKPVGENAGREFGRLVVHGFRATGQPETSTVRVDVVKQVAIMTHAIGRADVSLAGQDPTYRALSVVSEWFDSREWERVCDASGAAEALSRVREDVEKSLLQLATAGKPDDRLRQALVVAAGSRKNADVICQRMATQHPGIPDDVRDWLAGASRRTQVSSATESRERSIDEVLGELLIMMTKLTRASSVVQSEVLPDVSIVLPQSVRALTNLTGTADAMASKLNLAVAWRSLRTRGKVGQEVEFSPVDHQFLVAGTRSRRVRLLSPIVERISEDGVPRVVLKAAVEPTPVQPESTVSAGRVSA